MEDDFAGSHAAPVRSTSALLDDIDTAAYEVFAQVAQPPALIGELRHLGGALARVPAAAGCLGGLRGRYQASGAGLLTDQNGHELEVALQRFDNALGSFDNGMLYYNFAEAPADTRRFYTSVGHVFPAPSPPDGARPGGADRGQPPDHGDGRWAIR